VTRGVHLRVWESNLTFVKVGGNRLAIYFSPLGKLPGRAIYFACVNFFFLISN